MTFDNIKDSDILLYKAERALFDTINKYLANATFSEDAAFLFSKWIAEDIIDDIRNDALINAEMFEMACEGELTEEFKNYVIRSVYEYYNNDFYADIVNNLNKLNGETVYDEDNYFRPCDVAINARMGVSIAVTADELEKICAGEPDAASIVRDKLNRKEYVLEGESFIPNADVYFSLYNYPTLEKNGKFDITADEQLPLKENEVKLWVNTGITIVTDLATTVDIINHNYNGEKAFKSIIGDYMYSLNRKTNIPVKSMEQAIDNFAEKGVTVTASNNSIENVYFDFSVPDDYAKELEELRNQLIGSSFYDSVDGVIVNMVGNTIYSRFSDEEGKFLPHESHCESYRNGSPYRNFYKHKDKFDASYQETDALLKDYCRLLIPPKDDDPKSKAKNMSNQELDER